MHAAVRTYFTRVTLKPNEKTFLITVSIDAPCVRYSLSYSQSLVTKEQQQMALPFLSCYSPPFRVLLSNATLKKLTYFISPSFTQKKIFAFSLQ